MSWQERQYLGAMRDLRGLRILSTLTCVLTFPAQQLVRMPKTALTCFFSGDWGKMKMGRWYLGAEPTHINTSSLSSFIHSSLIQLFYDSVGSLHSGTPRTRRCVNGAHTGTLTFALHSHHTGSALAHQLPASGPSHVLLPLPKMLFPKSS